jgi:hypothetical protein
MATVAELNAMISVVEVKQIEQPKAQAGGRPPGSKNKPRALLTRRAHERLAELAFDPIEELIKQHKEVSEDMLLMRFNEDGTEKERWPAMAYAQLANLKGKITADLLRFGYARAMETTEVQTKDVTPVNILLTSKGDKLPEEEFPMISDTEALRGLEE